MRDSEIEENQPSQRPGDPENPGGDESNLEPVLTSWGFYCFANLAGWEKEDVERFAAGLGVDPSRIQINAESAGAKPMPEKQPTNSKTNGKE